MSIPIIFIHRTDNDYLHYILQQAKLANPQSDVILIGSQQNSKYATAGVKHAMIRDYFTGSEEFAKVYKHMSPCEYYYNLFCFQRWFVLRDYMRQNRIDTCWVIDSDIMVYADMSRPEYSAFSNEITMTSYSRLPEIEELCSLTLDYFRDPHLFEVLKKFTYDSGHYIKETGMLAISDMVTQLMYYQSDGKRVRNNGVFNNSFFDTNLYFAFPGVEMLDNKKKVYLIDGTFFCKKTDTGQYIRVNSIHFTTEANKPYIQHFYMPNLSKYAKGAYFFNYGNFGWTPTAL